MSENEHDIVQGIVISRKNLVELVIVAVLLAFGINLIASQFLSLPIATPIVTTLFGVVLCLASVLYITKNLFGNRLRGNTYKAFVVFDQPQKKLIPVPRYEFAEMICLYVEAAFAENSTIKARWDKQPLETCMFSETEDENIYSIQLLFEAVEYFFLDQLSIRLSDYFSNRTFKESNLIKYGRKDIPDVLPLLSITGWSYYHWVDSFLKDFEKDVSKTAFFDRISWENTAVILECLNRISKEKRRPKSIQKKQGQGSVNVSSTNEKGDWEKDRI